jgi:hypothetical protein
MAKIFHVLDKRVALYVFLPFSFFYLFLFINQGINVYDEGLVVYGALRVMQGDVPYKDFWAIYAPGQFYVLAGVFKLFGVSLMVERVWSTFVRLALLVCTYLIARKIVTQKFSLVSCFLLMIWLGSFQFYGSPIIPSLLFALLGGFCCLNFLQKQRRVWLFMAGIMTGITALFRHDIGFYTLFSVILIIFSFIFFISSSRGASIADRIFRVIKLGTFYVGGTAIIFLPIFFYFIHSVPKDDLVLDFIKFPFVIYPKVRALPFPSPLQNFDQLLSGTISLFNFAIDILNRLPFYAPLITYTIIIIIFLARISQRIIEWGKWENWGILFLLILGIVFFNHVLVRSGSPHLMATFIPSMILFSVVLMTISQIKKFRVLFWGFAFFLGFSFIGSSLYKTRHLFLYGLLFPNKMSFTLDRAQGIYGNWEWVTNYQKAITYIQDRVSKDERIYIGSTRHDKVFNNDIMFYYLSERHSATKFHDLHPGITTTAEIQTKIVADIESWQVKYIVLHDDSQMLKKEMHDYTGSHILDNFIRANFFLEKKFGLYSIWRRC